MIIKIKIIFYIFKNKKIIYFKNFIFKFVKIKNILFKLAIFKIKNILFKLAILFELRINKVIYLN